MSKLMHIKIWRATKVVVEILYLIVFRRIAALIRTDPKKIVFGAWWGRQFGDNAKYFMKYLLSRNEGFKCYWVGDEYLRNRVAEFPDVKFIRKGSWLVAWHLLSAKWAFFCLGMKSDISGLPTFGKVRLLSMWHGTGFKGAANRSWEKRTYEEFTGIQGKILRYYVKLRDAAYVTHCDASFSSSRMVEYMQFEAPWSFSKDRSINGGTAKIDFLIQNANNQSLKAKMKVKYARLLGLPEDKRWYLYMPTWRKDRTLKYSFSNSKLQISINQLLESQGAVIVEKQHPQVIHEMKIKEWHSGNIHIVSNDAMPCIDGQELLLAADRMISDYSGCLFEFEAMNRPVIHFAYDLDEYDCEDRGFEFNLSDIAAGPIAKTEGALLDCLKMTDQELLESKGPKWKDPIDGELGNGCETLARWVGLVD